MPRKDARRGRGGSSSVRTRGEIDLFWVRPGGAGRQAIKMMCSVVFFSYVIRCLIRDLFGGGQPAQKDLNEAPQHAKTPLCGLFLAPSLVSGRGWGVFAARRFEKDEILEFAPLYVTLPAQYHHIRSTALGDYMLPLDDVERVVLGSSMVINHSPNPNVKWVAGGESWAKVAAMKATRVIQPGEEIFNNYGLEDGGSQWFRVRRIQMDNSPNELSDRSASLAEDTSMYCTKTTAGIGWDFLDRVGNGDPSLRARIPIWKKQVPPADAGFGAATARIALSTGDIIEIAPALLLPTDQVSGTPLSPLVVEWNHLTDSQREAMRKLHREEAIVVQRFGKDNGWKKEDAWGKENVVLLPLGWIAMVKRVGRGSTEANCELQLRTSGTQPGSRSLTVDFALVATRPVLEGATLRVAMPTSGNKMEMNLLEQNLLQTGQPIERARQKEALRPVELPLWKACGLFLAPSLVPGRGWGAFAARRFAKDEIVEFAPLYVTLPAAYHHIRSTALGDYMLPLHNIERVVLGSSMVINHSPNPNVRWVAGGKDSAQVAAMKATRVIQAGEEIFNNYGLEDGGAQWFRVRRLQMSNMPNELSDRSASLAEDASLFCPKSMAGIGGDFLDRVGDGDRNLRSHIPNWKKQVPPAGAGWGAVTARAALIAGDLIELAPALLLPLDGVSNTPLLPLIVEWSHLTEPQRETMRELHTQEAIVVQRFGKENGWRKQDAWGKENVALLPLGWIAMVKRVGRGSDEANCEFQLRTSGVQPGGRSLTVDIALIAIQPVLEGTLLKVALPASGQPVELDLFKKNLWQTGQPA